MSYQFLHSSAGASRCLEYRIAAWVYFQAKYVNIEGIMLRFPRRKIDVNVFQKEKRRS